MREPAPAWPSCARCGEPLGWGPALPQRDESGTREYVHRDACVATASMEIAAPVEPTSLARPVGQANHSRGATAATPLLDKLDDEQRAAVLAPIGPVRILAGAGTGKTRSITHRIAYYHHLGEAPAQQVLAVTHSRRAASEMRDRLEKLGAGGARAATFHSAALAQLRRSWKQTGLPGERLVVLSGRSASGCCGRC